MQARHDPKEQAGRQLPIADRLRLARDAGFDGVDFDQAGEFTPEEASEAVRESGVFVHNAINHAHWSDRLTSADEAVRAKGRANIEHRQRVAQPPAAEAGSSSSAAATTARPPRLRSAAGRRSASCSRSPPPWASPSSSRTSGTA